MSEKLNLSLDLLNESLERVGKRQMPIEDLKKFVIETLKYETKKLQERKKLYDAEEIKENEINDFDFYSDGYHTGIYIKLTEDSLYSLGTDKQGNKIYVIQYPKKDPDTREILLDDDGEPILTNRCRMKIKTRLGGIGIFLGLNKVATLEGEDRHFVFSGGLSVSYIVANPKSKKKEDMYHKVPVEGVEYSTKNYTFNLWQIAEIIKKGKTLGYKVDFDCNWKEDDED